MESARWCPVGGKGGYGGYSIGSSWVGDVLRRLVGARGRWTPPDRYSDFVQSIAELRPQFFWEYWQARWVHGLLSIEAAAVAGQFGYVDVTLPAGVGRYALCYDWQFSNSVLNVGLYLNRALINGTQGAGVTDMRARASGAAAGHFTPMIMGAAAGSNAALPAVATRAWYGAATSEAKVGPILFSPGTTVTFCGQTVNQGFTVSCRVIEIPADDIDG